MTKRKTKQIFPELDRYCGEILFRLILIGRKIRFKDLREFLIKSGASLSKPTLSKHLKHLTEEKLVVRKIEDVHNVSYEVNHKRFGELEKYVQSIAKSRMHLAEQDEKFDSLSTDDQINVVLEKMLLRNLRQLKTNVELELNPATKGEKLMILQWLADPAFRHHEGLLVDKCKDDREYGEKLLQKLDELIREIKNLNARAPEPSSWLE